MWSSSHYFPKNINTQQGLTLLFSLPVNTSHKPCNRGSRISSKSAEPLPLSTSPLIAFLIHPTETYRDIHTIQKCKTISTQLSSSQHNQPTYSTQPPCQWLGILSQKGKKQKRRNSHLIHPRRERLSNKSGDLVHVPVRLPRVQDPGEPTHLRIGPAPVLLEPVVHHPALPSVVHRIGSRDRRVEQPPPPAPAAEPPRSVEGHLDDGVHGEPGRRVGRAGEFLPEWGIGGDEDVVGDERHREGYQHREEGVPATHLFAFALQTEPLSLLLPPAQQYVGVQRPARVLGRRGGRKTRRKVVTSRVKTRE